MTINIHTWWLIPLSRSYPSRLIRGFAKCTKGLGDLLSRQPHGLRRVDGASHSDQHDQNSQLLVIVGIIIVIIVGK